MPGYFNYSPWTDAANYGRGFGQTLAQALIRAPQERENLAEQRARFPLEQELTEAQIHSALAQPELRKMMYDAAMGRNANQKEHYENEDANAKERTGNTKDYNEKRVKLGQQNADTRTAAQQEHASYDSQKQGTTAALAQGKIALDAVMEALGQKKIDTMGQPKMQTGAQTDSQVKRGMDTQKLLGASLGNPNQVPSASVAEYAAKEQQQQPTNSLMSILQSIMTPNRETNRTWMHPISGEVTTNGAHFTVPGQPPPMTQGAPVPVAQQPMANAPAPMTPHGMVRVVGPDGVAGQIPLENLAKALARGFKRLE